MKEPINLAGGLLSSPNLIPIPKFLFRYLRDDAHLLETLATPYLWFSDPATLNDPFDLTNVLEVSGTADEFWAYMSRSLGRALEELKLDKETFQQRWDSKDHQLHEFVEAVTAAVHSDYLKKTGLCCFSYHHDTPLMWAHYAGGHSGVCMAIEVTPALLQNFALIEVQYRKHLPKWNMVKNRLLYGSSMTYNQRFDQVVLGTKYLDWAYEREYRLISRKRGKHLLDPASLVGVLCGAKMAASRKEELRAQVNACVPHVSFVDAALDKSSGGVSIPEFTNAVIPVQISSWRMLDDQLGQGREIGSGELIARPAPVCASKAFKMHSWVFRYRLKRKRSAKPISTPMN